MINHVFKSGKVIANIDHHTVPTGLVKARRFLDDEYVKRLNVPAIQTFSSLKENVVIVLEKVTPHII